MSKSTDNVLSYANVFKSSKHLVAERRNEPFERLPNEHELVVVFQRRAGKLRGVRKLRRLEVESEHGVHAAPVGGGDQLGGRVASQLEQSSQPAGTRSLADDAEQDPLIMTDNQCSSGVLPAVVVRQTRFFYSAMTLLLLLLLL